MKYRNMPFPDSPSPVQLLMNMRLRTTLPATDAYLTPSIPDPEAMPAVINKRHYNQKKNYDKTALSSSRPQLQPGASVLMQTDYGSTWRPAAVVSAAHAPRSYIVRTADGLTYPRNRNMLRETKETLDEAAVEMPATPRQANPPYTTQYGRQVRHPARFPDIEKKMTLKYESN